jgi:glycosyltransferase involved in cell wall biosynthesis
MKLAFFSYSDDHGGAAKAAFSIYKSVKDSYSKCFFFCIDKNNKKSIKLVNYLHFFYLDFLRTLEKIFIFFFRSKFHQSLNIFRSFNLYKINNINYDVINLHWINRCAISLKEILKIKKIILISLHDMWFLNGSSHYFNKNTINCLDKYILDLKKKIYKKKNIFFIVHSKWLYFHAVKLISKKKIFLSRYYPIDLNLFKPRNKKNLKKKFNIITKKKIVLFSAQNINDPRKGQTDFYNLVKHFYKKERFYFIIVGSGSIEKNIMQFDNFLHIPYLNQEQMSEVYSLSDIYVSTSIIDNLPLTILEAMSSGLVVISFNSGGAKEVIKNCGYLILNKNYRSIINILNRLTDKIIKKKSKKSRDFALKNFSFKKNRDNYLSITNKIKLIN